MKTWIANPDVWYPPPTPPEEKPVVKRKRKPKAKPEKPRQNKKRGRPVGAKDSKPRKRTVPVAPPPVALPTVEEQLDFFKETREELQALRARKIQARIRPRR